MKPITVNGRTYINVTKIIIETLDKEGKITNTEKINLKVKNSPHCSHHGRRVEMTFNAKNLGKDILKFCKKVIRKVHPVRKSTIIKLHSLQGVWVFSV